MLTLAETLMQTMVWWNSLTPQLDQQSTTPAVVDTFSAMETAPALVSKHIISRLPSDQSISANVKTWLFYV